MTNNLNKAGVHISPSMKSCVLERLINYLQEGLDDTNALTRGAACEETLNYIGQVLTSGLLLTKEKDDDLI